MTPRRLPDRAVPEHALANRAAVFACGLLGLLVVLGVILVMGG